MQIKYINDLDLFCRYPGQIVPQDCYIELNCDKQILTASYNPEIGNGIPFSVYHNRTLRWKIPCLKGNAANEVLDIIAKDAQVICDNYYLEWNGNNHVGMFYCEAERAGVDIVEVCDILWNYPDLQVSFCSASEYYSCLGDEAEICFKLGINGNTTDEELEEIERREQENSDVDIIDGAEKFFTYLRKWSRDNQLNLEI